VLPALADGHARALARGDGRAAQLERAGIDARLATLARLLDDGAARASLAELRRELARPDADVASVSARALAASAALLDEDAARHVRALASWPALASLSVAGALGLLAWTLALAALLARAPLATRAAGLCGAAALLAWLAALAFDVGASARRGGASLKQRLHAGELAVERAVLPPLFYGVAETHAGEALRPPTWLAAAARDEAGRAPPRAGALGGLELAATPVEVRWGEPGRNAPLRHVLGCDALGRDVAVRLVWGARVSLAVGLAAAALLTLLGLALGGLAGFLGGWIDALVSRAVELVLGFPALFLIVLAAAYTDPARVHPLAAIVGIIALVAWTGVARLVRSEMLRLREAPFVLAARSQGLPEWRVLLVHALPNALSPVLVAATFAVGASILTESTVSFLGFGVHQPWPSWGALIGESRDLPAWWMQVFPGLLLCAVVCAFNVLGEALRDALDPRLEGLR
jgi:peptide/nickel transport system permease protein